MLFVELQRKLFKMKVVRAAGAIQKRESIGKPGMIGQQRIYTRGYEYENNRWRHGHGPWECEVSEGASRRRTREGFGDPVRFGNQFEIKLDLDSRGIVSEPAWENRAGWDLASPELFRIDLGSILRLFLPKLFAMLSTSLQVQNAHVKSVAPPFRHSNIFSFWLLILL